jgi:hypothetical protein
MCESTRLSIEEHRQHAFRICEIEDILPLTLHINGGIPAVGAEMILICYASLERSSLNNKSEIPCSNIVVVVTVKLASHRASD